MRKKEIKIINNPNFSFLVFFLFSFFYYFLVFNSSLYYHNYQPIFLFDKTYLKEFLLYPGGPSELITQFFLQFFLINLLGAFFLSALSLSVFVIIYKLIKKIGDSKYSLILSFLPVALLLIIQNSYNYPLMITFKYLFALIFFFVYVKIRTGYKVFIIPLSFLTYYILGGWAYLFYIVLCISQELLYGENSRRYIYAVLNSLVYLIYPYIAARYMFIINLKEAYLYIMPERLSSWPFDFNLNVYFYLFFLSLPMLLAGLSLYLKYVKVKVKKVRGQKKSPAKIHHIPVQTIIIILTAVLILTFSFNRHEKNKIQIDYLAEKGRWQQLLSVAEVTKRYDVLIIFNVNRALYHTGQLLDNLFGYPQAAGANVLFLENIPRHGTIPASDLYFDLGHIKASLVLTYEGQTKFVNNPRMLKSIVLNNIINEEYVVAKKFLDLLNKSIMHKKWVTSYLNYLSNESLIKSDSLIQLKRKLTPKSDFFIAISEGADKDLIELLKENENNKMAFEYLMAYYLLSYRLEDLLKYLDEFKEFGYGKYPRHIEEALLLISFAYPSKKFEVDYSINQKTIERFDRFNSILSTYENKIQAKEALNKKGFYNTYWYYVLYLKPNETNPE